LLTSIQEDKCFAVQNSLLTSITASLVLTVSLNFHVACVQQNC